ncbi:hypothetical protein HY338_00400, partial [Candidatus Gottesmanbacteria bacterium]|nr:hypothetical protein [Candidatus Gottesmanbacteria bacterium]
MRRLPLVLLLFLTIIFSSPMPSWAMEKFGPHVSTNYDPGLLDTLRSKYNTAGVSDWVPLTVLIPVQISSESLSGFLDSAVKNKFWPIIRVWNEGRKILNGEIDQFTVSLTAVNDKNSSFPQPLVLVFGNEVNNLEDEWGGAVTDENIYLNTPQEYANALNYFISQVKAKAPLFKVANAPMNGSLPVFDLKTFDVIDFWNKGMKSVIPSLDYLAFNSYELGGPEQRSTISGWNWEWQQIGSPGKPIILTEFGFKPEAAIADREKFVGDEYQAYKNGQRGNLDSIFAITPLLWSNGPIKIPVFNSGGTVDWYDPADIGTGGGGGGATNATPTPKSYFASTKGKKLNDTLADINKSFLPYGVQIKKDDTKINSQGVSASDTTAGNNEDAAILNPAVQYSVGTSVQTPEKSSTGIAFFLKNLWEGFLGLFGYGNKKATQFSSIQTPHDVARKELARFSETQSKNLAFNNFDKNVLGFLYSDKAMENSLSLRQSENLPLSVGQGVKDQYGGGDNTLPNPPSGGGGCGSGNCPLGVGYCSPDYLNTNYFHDELKARKASIICQKESGSQPDSINRGCLRTDPASRTQEYSVGLYQINLWFDSRCAAGAALIDKVDTKPYSCKEGPNFDACTDEFKDPDRNIRFAVALSGQGTNWTDWSAAAACNIPGGDEPLPICQSPIGDNCPDDSQAIRIPNSDFQLLNYRGGCIKPTMIVIHWSAAWTDVYATFNTLNDPDKNYACQLATDKDRTLQMQYLYKDQVQRGVCVGDYNDFVLSNEITGSFFDEVYNNSSNDHYNTLAIETEKSLASTCFLMKQYNIP